MALLPALVRASTAEVGNLFYRVHQDRGDPYTLMLFEGYRDEAALADHRRSEHFQSMVARQIVPLLESREVLLTTPLEM